MSQHCFKIMRTGHEGSIVPRYSHYRGVYRLGPPHIDHVREDHPANRLFAWYCSEEERSGGSYDLERVRQLIQAYGEAAPSVTLEIIEVDEDGAGTTADGELLGTDLANRYGLSLLANGMLDAPMRLADNPKLIQEFCKGDAVVQIVAAYLRDRLNCNGLVNARMYAVLASTVLQFAELPAEVSGCRPIDIYLVP